MEQLNLSKWLKLITIGLGIFGVVIYFFMIPFYGRELIKENLKLVNWYWPWLILIWITSIPCFIVLIEFWNICNEIGKDNSFSKENVKSLMRISRLSLIDSCILFLGNIVLFILNMNNIGISLMMMMIVFAGIGISIVSAAVSHLVLKAYKIKEENELTI